MLPAREDRYQRLGLRPSTNERSYVDPRQAPDPILCSQITCSVRDGSFLSVVIPAKNEAVSLPQLVDEVALVLRNLCSTNSQTLNGFEIIVVDDGSTDETQSVLTDLTAAYRELKGIALVRSTGQSGATLAGIHAARGNWIATLDADLQNDPADLARLWHALPGHDVALGWRERRQDTLCKRVVSFLANFGRNVLLGQSIHDTGCSTRIFPRAVAMRLPVFQGLHRFLGPFLVHEGCQIVQVPVNHRRRIYGRSHYHIWNRSLAVIVDLLGVVWLMRRAVRGRVLRTWRVDGSCLQEADSLRSPCVSNNA